MKNLNMTSAKDFGRFPELLDQHRERLLRANDAAHDYLANDALLTHGLIIIPNIGVPLTTREACSVEILATRVGDGKHKTSMIPPAGPSRSCFKTVQPLLESCFRSRQADVLRELSANTYRQHLSNHPDDGDIQKVLHRDTFFPALKFWYFPDAVTEADGAFIYVRDSAELTDERMAWEMEQVVKVRTDNIEPWRGVDHRKGSFRTNEDEIARVMNLAPKTITVAADTLVVANVFGFHRRGDVTAPVERVSVHGSIRFKQPFRTEDAQ